MSIYSYKITRDFGFAPNPFYAVCTLATCKPDIRGAAKVGDWILGFGAAAHGGLLRRKLIFAMQVEQILTFNEYWESEEFQCKKPVMNGSVKQTYGDNIYHKEKGVWKQSDSHHSNPDGTPNQDNLRKDTSADAVLISRKYWYFGKNAQKMPKELSELVAEWRNYKKFDGYDETLETWLSTFEDSGYLGEPAMFDGGYMRYGGKS